MNEYAVLNAAGRVLVTAPTAQAAHRLARTPVFRGTPHRYVLGTWQPIQNPTPTTQEVTK